MRKQFSVNWLSYYDLRTFNIISFSLVFMGHYWNEKVQRVQNTAHVFLLEQDIWNLPFENHADYCGLIFK